MAWSSPIIRAMTYDEKYNNCQCDGKGRKPIDGIPKQHPAHWVIESSPIDESSGEIGRLVTKYICASARAEVVHRLNLYDSVMNKNGKRTAHVEQSPVHSPLPVEPDEVPW